MSNDYGRLHWVAELSPALIIYRTTTLPSASS
jgi:hypothetical protein